MGKYKKIAVIYGSDSSEWEVSCRSGEFVASRIDGTQYDVYEIFARFGQWQLVAMKKRDAMRVPFPEGSRPEIDKTDFSVKVYGEKVKFDYAYIVQHGTPGENGLLQGYLEMLGVPFSSCGAFVSTVAFDKFACKSYLRDVDFVKCSPDVFVRNGMDLDKVSEKIASTLKFPVFVKPTDGGSSFGITKVSSPEGVKEAINFAFSEGPMVIVEQGIKGRELTCAAYSDADGVKALPLIEIVTENDYFDYDAKYNGHSQEICPAPVEETVSAHIQEVTKKIYSHLGCKGVVRVDYIMSEDGLYFLEVNTIPGMTSASLVPKMVRTAGIDITDFLTGIIESS
ncbi:MAG: D-alanine--D-alanine ligase [Bacteroidales bacterium]|nr:D-alanine--D-alanine ligase [Bacteroidales bacterium]MBP3270360.1 D-alanine--D-alanine ligase [Bacteroidales bacterium]